MARNEIRCSFCGKTESQVMKLLKGPNGVYICDECVELCSEIIEEEMGEEEHGIDAEEVNRPGTEQGHVHNAQKDGSALGKTTVFEQEA